MSITSIMLKVLAMLMASFICINVNFTATEFEPENAEDIKLNITLLSDMHMEVTSRDSQVAIIKAFRSLKGSKAPIDALVLLGDNTMNSQFTESLLFYGAMQKNNPIEKVCLATGNHDIDTNERTHGNALNRHKKFFNAFIKPDSSQFYYYEVINGYYLIFTSTGSMDEEQINWLSDTVDLAAQSGKPFFIFSHHPNYYIENNDVYYKYNEIITRHPNAFLFCGHMHFYLSTSYMYGEYNTPEIWVPSAVTASDHRVSIESFTKGTGLQLEVYEDTVAIRYRNFIEGEWATDTIYYDIAA